MQLMVPFQGTVPADYLANHHHVQLGRSLLGGTSYQTCRIVVSQEDILRSRGIRRTCTIMRASTDNMLQVEAVCSSLNPPQLP
jgi:hypothetical protein